MAKSRGFENCLTGGGLKRFRPTKAKIKQELKAAEKDLIEAEDRYANEKYKYATVNSYYSLFHSARTLLYLSGYREKSHRCLKIAVEELYIKEKILPPEFTEYFEESMGMREAADYQSIFSKTGAERGIKAAKEFLEAAKEIIEEHL